jgi:predicted RNase H-like HicB family nuclease
MTTKVRDLIDQYLIVLEKSDIGFSAYSPDVAGCIATGDTLEDTTKLMRSALVLHLADVDELPKPRGIDAYVDALRDSEGEEFYLTHISVASLMANSQEVSREQSRN